MTWPMTDLSIGVAGKWLPDKYNPVPSSTQNQFCLLRDRMGIHQDTVIATTINPHGN
jgi:hypothetical protein